MARLLRISRLPRILAAAGTDDVERLCERKAAHRDAYYSYSPRPTSLRPHTFVATDVTHGLDDSLGWSHILTRGWDEARVPGTHFSIMDTYVHELGRALSTGFDNARGADAVTFGNGAQAHAAVEGLATW